MIEKTHIEQIQSEVAEWGKRNFPKVNWQQTAMGVSEEIGELTQAINEIVRANGCLNHSLLKQWQGIRGSAEEHEIGARDAVGDIVIFLIHLCALRGWSFDAIVRRTWDKVRKRDWQNNRDDGAANLEEPSTESGEVTLPQEMEEKVMCLEGRIKELVVDRDRYAARVKVLEKRTDEVAHVLSGGRDG